MIGRNVFEKIYLSGDNEAAYFNALKPYIDEIEKNILPNVSNDLVSKSPAYYGISYKKQVELAISGDFDALRHVGLLLYDGVYLPKDKPFALKLLKKMAFGSNELPTGFNSPAAYSYAKIILKEGDAEKSKRILERLIKTDFSPAFALIGNIHQYGYGVNPSFKEANKYYNEAQIRGHIYATALRAKLHLAQSSLIKKLSGGLLFLCFIWRVVLNELGKNKNDNQWSSFY